MLQRIVSNYLRIQMNRCMRRILPGSGGDVLEVGCGNDPSGYSTVLLDKYVDAYKLHRSSSGAIHLPTEKLFVLADGNYLPFKSNSFNAVISRHVIEHTLDPKVFLTEIQRVGTAGYIEWPSIFSELVSGGFGDQEIVRSNFNPKLQDIYKTLFHGSGSKGHRWFVVENKGVIYFLRKTVNEFPLYLLFGSYIKKSGIRCFSSKLFGIDQAIWDRSNPLQSVCLDYTGKSPASIQKPDAYDIKSQMIYLENANVNHMEALKENLEKFLCPSCKKGDLEIKEGKQLFCIECCAKYPLINGMPVLLPV